MAKRNKAVRNEALDLLLVAQALRRVRQATGLRQVDVAERSGLSKAMVSAYESGKALPTLPSLSAYLGAVGRGLDDLQAALTQLQGKIGDENTATLYREHVVGRAVLNALRSLDEPAENRGGEESVTMRKFKKIPVFATEDEEREFWANHDSTDYIDWSQAKSTDFPFLKKSVDEKGERMSFLLINASREDLEAAFTSAKLEVLAEGSPYDLALYASTHRDEVTELAFVLQTRLTKGPNGHRIEWCDAGRELLDDSGGDSATTEWERLVGQVVLDVLQALRERLRSAPRRQQPYRTKSD